MRAAPSGLVTFLFTDIEESTKRWERAPAQMAVAVARHDALLRRVIEANDGHVFKTVGDAFCAAFANPVQAVRAAIAAQHAVAAEPWEGVGAIRVRMALHTGTAEERANDYFGLAVNRVARLLSAGYGEQVLVSRSTAEMLRPALDGTVALADLGEHRLKDLLQAEHIFQLVAPGLVSEFPPIKTLDRQRHNLPAQATSLVGRDADVAAARDVLARDQTRLLTLVGPGGVGKTRLALQIAAEVIDDFHDGVWFVPLSALADAGLVVSQIGQALGIRDPGDGPLLARLQEELAGKQMLLVVDNFEHVAGAAPEIGALLSASPKLKVLMTSRTVSRIYGEREFAVGPLGLPPLRPMPPVAELEEYGAVRLFVERANAVRPDFALSDANAGAVAEVCVRLDGLPLAIELAASRVKLLPPQALLSRLQQRLKLLTGGGSDRDPRQQTLRATIAWSYDLLEPAEQVLFRRLAVFAGGATFEAAEHVVGGDGAVAIDVFDGLASLIDKSLLRQVEIDGGEPRFAMLQTLREFGIEQLEVTGELEAMQARHARYFVELATGARPALDSAEPEGALTLLETEHDNVRSALDWALRADVDAALQLADAVWLFWGIAGHVTEGRGWLARVLHQARAAGKPDPALVPVLKGAAALAQDQSDFAALSALANELLAICRVSGDALGEGFAWNKLGWAAASRGDHQLADSHYARSLETYRAAGFGPGESGALLNLGVLAFLRGDFDKAADLYEEALVLVRQNGTKANLPIVLGNLADALRHAGRHDHALAHYEEATRLYEELGDRYGIALVRLGLGVIAMQRGELDLALRFFLQCLEVLQDIGDRAAEAECLERLAQLAQEAGGHGEAARLFGYVGFQRERLGIPLQPAYRHDHDWHVEALRAVLGDDAFEQAIAAGATASLEELLGAVRAAVAATGGEASTEGVSGVQTLEGPSR